MCGRDIEKSICREMSGNLESGMVAVGMLCCFEPSQSPLMSSKVLLTRLNASYDSRGLNFDLNTPLTLILLILL